jgi:sugar (pentulose or hexulose) kinase
LAGPGDVVVLDVGKTLSKLSRWSRAGELLDKVTRPNPKVEADGIAVLDAAGIGEWVAGTLKAFAAKGPVTAIIPVAHGAGVAVLRNDELARAPLDYEQDIPAEILADYRSQRDPFAETGSPALPHGLNLGAQLHWLVAELDGATLLPWAQYWSWFLSGVATSEVTSLGCHSDLWNPAAGDFSSLARRRGWAERFAPLARAREVIGTLKSEFGLGEDVTVHCGIHDSNAALVAARGFAGIAGHEATVLSTGTWFIAMRAPGAAVDLAALPEDRDCLVNVDCEGRPTPSARFMGGREIELLGERIDVPGLDGIADVLIDHAMVLPSQVRGSGPFPDGFGRWINQPEDPAARRAAVALYAALMADSSLDLIGAQQRLLIEGRFAGSELFVRALAALRPGCQVFTTSAEADVSFGALRLICPDLKAQSALVPVTPLDRDLTDYRAEWHDDIAAFA